MRISLGIILVALVALTSACSTPQRGARGINDGSASMAVKTRMLRSVQDFSGVDVTVVDGLALLTGHVPDEVAKDEAGRIAWSAPNVRDVANELAIEERGRTFFGANDQFVLTQVRARIVADNLVRATSIHIEVNNGVVYLLGRARTSDEARRIAGHASLASGAERVVSFIRADDASIGVPRNTAPYDPFPYEGEDAADDGADDGARENEADDGLLGGPSE